MCSWKCVWKELNSGYVFLEACLERTVAMYSWKRVWKELNCGYVFLEACLERTKLWLCVLGSVFGKN